MPKLKFYFKIFIILFPLILVFSLLMDKFLLHSDKSFINSIMSSLFSGIMFTLIMGFFHFREFRKNGLTEFTDENLSLKQRRVVDSNLNHEELLDKLKKDNYFKKFKFNLQDEAIIIKTSSSDMSFGEIVKIIPIGIIEDCYQYSISSIPKNKLNFLDGGANYFNVTKVQQLI